MCGIAVAIGWPGAPQAVKGLIEGLVHRGDVTDPVVSLPRDVAMCTRRLRIVDPEHAVQPAISSGGSLFVAFNGEIYNHLELRLELERTGVKFRSDGDAEVIASALEQWGPAALGRFNGMYAFVAYNDLTGEFLAARDPLGVKPLYAMQVGAAFLFCSEMRPLLKIHPDATVHALPPGCLLTRQALQRFKSVGWGGDYASLAHDERRLDRLLDEAVLRRLPPQLPAAVFFSGGIDSTLVLHYARQYRPETPGYFLGGPGAPDYEFAARYAEATGLDFRPVPLPDPFASPVVTWQEVVRTHETFEPETIKNAFCTSALSARAREDGFRVVLSGEGADELFAGYPILEESFADDETMGVFVRNQHLHQMHATVLQRLDRCGMRNQVEIREPFLDPGIVDYALGLKGHELVRPVSGLAQGKQPLRDLYNRYPDALPHQIRDRHKVALNVGAGFEDELAGSPWKALAEENISDAEFQDGLRRFEKFDLRTKEELLYLDYLARDFDVHRVPHLTLRARIYYTMSNTERLQSRMVADASS